MNNGSFIICSIKFAPRNEHTNAMQYFCFLLPKSHPLSLAKYLHSEVNKVGTLFKALKTSI
jgi:hypothetical protein